MEASDLAAPLDATQVHAALDQAAAEYHATFDGHVPDEISRFDAFLATVRMIVDQSALQAVKDQS